MDLRKRRDVNTSEVPMEATTIGNYRLDIAIEAHKRQGLLREERIEGACEVRQTRRLQQQHGTTTSQGVLS